jgi:hypothetical protein
VEDTPEALLARNQAAIDQVAAMLPTNSNEAAFAAQCVAALAQADYLMQLIRAHAGHDLKVVGRLSAMCAAMTRVSQGAHGHVLRAQAVRYKREQAMPRSRPIVSRSMGRDPTFSGNETRARQGAPWPKVRPPGHAGCSPPCTAGAPTDTPRSFVGRLRSGWTTSRTARHRQP